MTLIYYDPVFLEHDTGGHPENAGRLRAIVDRPSLKTKFGAPRQAWQPATKQQISRVHSAETVEQIASFIDAGGGRIEQDTVVSAASLQAARSASGAACDAARRVIAGDDKNAFCMLRPPGHHALHDRPMGFCLLNHVAVAARSAIKDSGMQRVMIIDWDVHHGNGTQATFWEDPSVAFLSMHRFPFYPGSGDSDETGGGDGLGLTANLPIRYGTSPQDQLAQFRNACQELADRFKPELILISAGFDSHADDPIGVSRSAIPPLRDTD